MTPLAATAFSCGAVRERLHALLDGELRVQEYAAVTSHLDRCDACASVLEDYRAIGAVLRGRVDATSVPSQALAEMSSRVVSLTTAEIHQSVRYRLAAAFDDLRFVFAGAGSFAATLLCALSLAGILHAASPGRNDSLASLMERMSAPRGSTLNPLSVDPRIMPPKLQESLVMPAVLVDDVMYLVPDEEYAFAAVLTPDGRVAGVETLRGSETSGGARTIELLHSMYDARFKPARLGVNGRAVAVSVVWVHSDVTVRPAKNAGL